MVTGQFEIRADFEQRGPFVPLGGGRRLGGLRCLI
jgi:hypothetical protein